MAPGKPVVFFDGVCNLCNRAVQWILKYEKDETLLFASLQSRAAGKLLSTWQGQNPLPDSIIFFEDGKWYAESDAILRISRYLRFPFNLLRGLSVIPRFIRDPLYRIISRNRYRWFGKRQQCMIPEKSVSHRFLE